jgi:hypothetical protein
MEKKLRCSINCNSKLFYLVRIDDKTVVQCHKCKAILFEVKA